jgi:hypothetical protein
VLGRVRRAAQVDARAGQRAAASSDSVHHTARVTRCRGGRSSGTSPIRAPVSAHLWVKLTTCRVTCTSPNLTSAGPQAAARSSPRISTSVAVLAVVV